MKVTRSQAVLKSPRSGTYSIRVWPSGSYPSVSARTRCLLALFAALAAGSARFAPSPPPSRLVPDQERTRRLRIANIGASTDFSSVSPVLPSCPA